MINIDAHNHVRGKSIYLDDIQEIQGTLYALPFDATVAHAKIKSLNLEAALHRKGIVTILTAKDIPGENQIGGILPDEPLFADGEVHFRGQVIALIIELRASLSSGSETDRGSLRRITCNHRC